MENQKIFCPLLINLVNATVIAVSSADQLVDSCLVNVAGKAVPSLHLWLHSLRFMLLLSLFSVPQLRLSPFFV